MDALIVLVVAVLALVLFDLAAMRWGVDSRVSTPTTWI